MFLYELYSIFPDYMLCNLKLNVNLLDITQIVCNNLKNQSIDI